MSNGPRLAHGSFAAFRRLMQMSQRGTFVFVEGWRDRYFYGRVCESVRLKRPMEYELRLACEICANDGGKTVLLDFFRYLEQAGSLVDNFKGKRTVSIFFVDKDVDDLLGARAISQHVVYTRFYNVENHLVVHGDLVRALAAAATLDERSVRCAFRSGNTAWRRDAAGRWKDWTKLCLFTRVRNLRHECNYGVRQSRINNGAYAPVDEPALAARLVQLERQSGLTHLGFKRAFGRTSRLVEGMFDGNDHDLVFNGKWYTLFLTEKATTIAAGQPFNQNGLPERILSCLQQSLNFQGRWALHFKRPLEAILRYAA
jgi:hypothetical protein